MVTANAGNHLRGEERVATESEEVVGDANFFHAEQLLPDFGDLVLNLRAGRHMLVPGAKVAVKETS